MLGWASACSSSRSWPAPPAGPAPQCSLSHTMALRGVSCHASNRRTDGEEIICFFFSLDRRNRSCHRTFVLKQAGFARLGHTAFLAFNVVLRAGATSCEMLACEVIYSKFSRNWSRSASLMVMSAYVYRSAWHTNIAGINKQQGISRGSPWTEKRDRATMAAYWTSIRPQPRACAHKGD